MFTNKPFILWNRRLTPGQIFRHNFHEILENSYSGADVHQGTIVYENPKLHFSIIFCHAFTKTYTICVFLCQSLGSVLIYGVIISLPDSIYSSSTTDWLGSDVLLVIQWPFICSATGCGIPLLKQP